MPPRKIESVIASARIAAKFGRISMPWLTKNAEPPKNATKASREVPDMPHFFGASLIAVIEIKFTRNVGLRIAMEVLF